MAPPRKSHASVSTFEEHPAPRPGRAAKCDGGVGTLVNRGISNSMSRCLPGLRRVPAGSGTFERRTRSHRIRRFPTFGAPHATFSSQSCEYAEKARKPIKNQLRLSIGHLKPGNTEVTNVSGPYSPQGQPGGGPYSAPSGGPYGAPSAGQYGQPVGGQYGQQDGGQYGQQDGSPYGQPAAALTARRAEASTASQAATRRRATRRRATGRSGVTCRAVPSTSRARSSSSLRTSRTSRAAPRCPPTGGTRSPSSSSTSSLRSSRSRSARCPSHCWSHSS